MKASKKRLMGYGKHRTTEFIVKKQNGQLVGLMYRPTDYSINKGHKIKKEYDIDFADYLSHEVSVGGEIIIKNKNRPYIKGIVIAICHYDWDYNKPAGVKSRTSNISATDNWNIVYKQYRNQKKRILNIKRKKYSLAIKYISLCAKLELNPIKDFTRINKKVKLMQKDGLKEINDLIVEDKILNAYRKLTDYTNIVNPKVYISLAKQFSLSVEQIKKIIQPYKYYK